jgi:Fe-S cluster assembly iron-binding protein IscA
MLQLTRAAAVTLDQVRQQQGLPDSFGVRIFPAETPAGDVTLGVVFTDAPSEGDEVTQQHGTQVILASEVATHLDGMTVDAVPDPSSDGAGAPRLVLLAAGE